MNLAIRKTYSILCLAIAFLLGNRAFSAGLNSESFSPAVDNQSGILWETAKSIPKKSLLFAYTSSYALRPVEFGDGKDDRLRVADHFQINHLGLGFGLLDWLDVGFNLPIALYAAPSNRQNALAGVGTSRNFFFLGDARVRVKASFQSEKTGPGFYGAALFSVALPSGSNGALLSDDTVRLFLEFPMHLAYASGLEWYLTPGVSAYGDRRRLSRNQGNESVSVLEKNRSLLLNTGLRYWLFQDGYDGQGLQLEAGIRGDFDDFKPSLNGRGSPVEWSAGGGMWLSKALSVHGAFGTGIGSGVTAPLTRIVAGVRYLLPAEEKKAAAPPSKILEATEPPADLEQIFKNAQAAPPPAPVEMSPDSSSLKLLTETELIDLGPIEFEFNSAVLTPQAKASVLKLFNQLQTLRPSKIAIEGHTDSVGSFAYNMNLSRKRAVSVKAELVRLGSNGDIISTLGQSFNYPLTSNGVLSGRNQNRRIEVALNGKTFRNNPPSAQEAVRYKNWIFPGGKQPKKNTNMPN